MRYKQRVYKEFEALNSLVIKCGEDIIKSWVICLASEVSNPYDKKSQVAILQYCTSVDMPTDSDPDLAVGI